jgi:hypothetical protein
MTIKLLANKESFGFLDRHWIKGMIIEVSKEVKYPEHFDLIENEQEEVKKPIQEKALKKK